MIQEIQTAPLEARYSFDAAEHVHRLDGKPLMGTSTVVSIISKELTWWASGIALTPLGWLNKRKSTVAERTAAADTALLKIEDMTRREYSDFLETCYRAHVDHRDKAATAGTGMHLEIQKYIEACIYDNKGEPYDTDFSPEVHRFSVWSMRNVAEFLWSEGHCYSERLWTGGICDCGAFLKGGKFAVIDFKSSREAYFSQLVQCGGYAAQITENGVLTRDGITVMDGSTLPSVDVIMVFPFGGDATEPHARYDVAKWQAAFEAAVTLHKLREVFEQ